jgi:hypothetical protein
MIQEMRSQLISDLSGLNIPIHEPWPGRVNAPCAIVGIPVGQYITKGQTFGSYEVSMTVALLVPKGPTYLADLEALIELTLFHTAGDWACKGVDQPTVFTESGMELLGTTILLAKQGKPT